MRDDSVISNIRRPVKRAIDEQIEEPRDEARRGDRASGNVDGKADRPVEGHASEEVGHRLADGKIEILHEVHVLGEGHEIIRRRGVVEAKQDLV